MSAVLTRAKATRSPAGPGEWRELFGHAVAATGEARTSELADDDSADVQAGGRLTLEQRLESVWEGLRAGGAPTCPVCQAGLEPHGDGAAFRCDGCGSVLS